ncbi:MAG: hypothetical protein QOH09_679 [Pseudonocardiales bacterium]|nr:hypothetical protein [Pseudonocardiales bacterium]
MPRWPVAQCQRRGGQCAHLDIGAGYGGPCVAIDHHRALGAAGPGGEAGGSAGALYSLVTPVLFVAVWPAGAHSGGAGVDDAATPVRTFQVGCPATVQVTFGQRMGDHVSGR